MVFFPKERITSRRKGKTLSDSEMESFSSHLIQPPTQINRLPNVPGLASS
jgi:hypothetical protein